MKSRLFISVFLLTGLAYAGLSGRTTNPSDSKKRIEADSGSIPTEIFKIMENSCLACHGIGGRAMALSHLKLSEWDGYSAAKQAQKAAAIRKMVSGGKMPPRNYLKNNPQATLTKVQIESIRAWSAAINKGK